MSSVQGWRRIGIEKDDILIADLTQDLPSQFGDALEYIRDLKFAEEPDYMRLFRSFTDLLMQMDSESGGAGGKLVWEKEMEV
jgi:hypothetical protein